MLDFQNNTLNIDDLPRFEKVEGIAVDSKYLKVLRILYLFWFLVFIGAWLTVFLTASPIKELFFVLLGILVILFALIITEIEKGFSRRKFGIREKDILFQRGFFVYKETLVPYKRIQHIELRQSLLLKAFKLYSLKIYTAGSSSGDLSIKGLDQINADKIKAQILKVADIDED
ncbi:PH domain-containing protein [Brumimicrobium oceani]|uniref:YdbS-like PH domain-containing protein n=1 Tax=Brumimicrobium oceani TaxID=2100725 RepID=A0A2U2XHG0_9FLAO|nr:PH domain-containing protein [Brumimicrobium oceani]PWH87213.1 hypothetical protein DIT68_02820 [Brumimicrobium oceani]